jgi:hypothetical protein
MRTGGDGQVDWDALSDWFRGTRDVVDDLNSCSVVVLSMMIGSPASNRRALRALDVLTRDAELWLLSHPCPEWRCGVYLSSIVEAFASLGLLLAEHGGDAVAADDGTLAGRVEHTCQMVQDLQSVANRYSG